jgi:hypothetical protein
MKCPYLIRTIGYSCFAGEKPYSPSVIQLDRYCRTKESRRCPLLWAPLAVNRKETQGSHEKTEVA